MGLVRNFRGLVKLNSFDIVDSSATILLGSTYEIPYIMTPSNPTNNKIYWTTSDSSVATVNNGVVTPVEIGTTTITAVTDYKGYTDSISITVNGIHATGVSLNKSSITVNAGEPVQLVATVTPSNATDKRVSWSSSNTSVATVSSSGLVTYVGDGNCTITATTVDGNYTATCSVVCVSALYINFLLVAGGGGGSQYYGGGGGAGGVIQCTNYCIERGSYSIVIGAGGCGQGTSCDGVDGGNSTALGFTAYGGGGGGGYPSRPGHNGGSGGGAGYYNGGSGGTGCTGQGHNGAGLRDTYSSGGGGGAGTDGFLGNNRYMGGYGGCGIQSNIDGTCKWYASGGTGHNGYNCCAYNAAQAWCTALNGTRNESNANICGGGGGGIGGPNANYGKGACGVFIINYPSSCGYNITGGTKYLCNGYCIHCFTTNGTLVIS